MTEQHTGRPVSVVFRAPRPLPVPILAALIDLAQAVADQLDAGPVLMGKNFRQEGDDFVFSFTGHANATPVEEPTDQVLIYTASSKDPIR
ncbi:hypothetical protein [Streptomyces phaeoluteigriseus]